MTKSRYEYGTTPRKLEPDIRKKNKTKSSKRCTKTRSKNIKRTKKKTKKIDFNCNWHICIIANHKL